jgi:hypothetical protein
MNVFESFDDIIKYSHYWNWAPDWQIAKEIYEAFPNAYAVLLPFSYTYLEELIRSITSEYGIEVLNKDGRGKIRSVGIRLINLAVEENKNKNQELLKLLEDLKVYFVHSSRYDIGDNRNSVMHGYVHPIFWNKDSFEKLIYDIARMSKFSEF